MKRRPTGAGNDSAGGGLQLDVGPDGGLALLASNFAGCKRARVHADVDLKEVKNDKKDVSVFVDAGKGEPAAAVAAMTVASPPSHPWHLLGYDVAVRHDTVNCWVRGKISEFPKIGHICVEYTSEDLIVSYVKLM